MSLTLFLRAQKVAMAFANCNWARAGVPSVYVCINPSGKPDGRSAEVLGIKGFGLQRDPPRFTTTWEDDAGALSAALSLSHGG